MKQKLSTFIFPTFVILSAFIGFSLVKNTQQPENHTVRITKGGFIPKNITIRQNDKVIWINTDSNAHWPASDFHPTHSEYPSQKKGCISSALDSCAGLKKNEEFSFIFDTTGTWDMHDHLFPEKTMSVKVVEKNALISGVSNLIDKTFTLFQNTRPISVKSFRHLTEKRKREIINELAKKDPKNAWEFLKDASTTNGKTIANSHEFAHIIGATLYNKYGVNGISTCGSDFSYGCYHGAISAALIKEGLPAIKTLENNCLSSFKTENKQNPKECMHGLGHGIITIHNLEINPSIKDCDVLKSKQYRRDCYMGVFMEYSYSAPSTNLNKENPWRFCTELPSTAHSACAAYFPKLLMQKHNNDLSKIGSICMSTPDPVLWKSCMNYIGAVVAVESLGDKNKVSEQCKKMESNKTEIYCIIGAVPQIKYENYPNWMETGTFLCQRIPDEYHDECIKNFNYVSD
jgi:plastocyanin